MTLEELKQDIQNKFPELFETGKESQLLEAVKEAAIKSSLAAAIAQGSWAISYRKNKEYKPAIYDCQEQEKWQEYLAIKELAKAFSDWWKEFRENQIRQLTLF